MTRNLLRDRFTVEELAADCLDVRELHRAGLLKEHSVTLRPLLRWPKIATLRTDRFVIQVNLQNQVVPQYIHLSWTPCHFGSYRPWMLCPHCRKRVARLFTLKTSMAATLGYPLRLDDLLGRERRMSEGANLAFAL